MLCRKVKTILVIMGICCFPMISWAQVFLSGRIVDKKTNEPVVGATVLVKGTKTGVVTDLDGKFTILNVPSSARTVGRVWNREELIRIGEICLRNHVTVVADEIHCELVFPGYTYTPFASISQEFLMNSVTCISPSKAFNLAGVQIANIVSADTYVRKKIDKAININEVCDVNPFGVEALIAAYNEGEEWLEELKRYLFDNYNYLRSFFAEHLPELPVTKLEGTYLVWVDCSALKRTSEDIVSSLLEQGKLWLNEGSMYGDTGEGFVRINIACPRQVLTEGLERFRQWKNGNY